MIEVAERGALSGSGEVPVAERAAMDLSGVVEVAIGTGGGRTGRILAGGPFIVFDAPIGGSQIGTHSIGGPGRHRSACQPKQQRKLEGGHVAAYRPRSSR